MFVGSGRSAFGCPRSTSGRLAGTPGPASNSSPWFVVEMRSSLAKAFHRAYRRFARKFGHRRKASRRSIFPRQSDAVTRDPLSACLLHRGFLEAFLHLRSILPGPSRQLDAARFLDFLVRDGEIARTPPPIPVAPAGLAHAVLCVGGSPSDAPACFLTSTEFTRLLSTSAIPALQSTLQNITQLVILDEKAASALLISREAMGVVGRQISHGVTLYGNFTRQDQPVYCPDSNRIFFSPTWLLSNAFSQFPVQSIHGPRLNASGWTTGRFSMRDASDPDVLLDRWMGFATWSRF